MPLQIVVQNSHPGLLLNNLQLCFSPFGVGECVVVYVNQINLYNGILTIILFVRVKAQNQRFLMVKDDCEFGCNF